MDESKHELKNLNSEEERQKEIAERMIRLMEKGLYSVGKGWKFNREEAHERN